MSGCPEGHMEDWGLVPRSTWTNGANAYAMILAGWEGYETLLKMLALLSHGKHKIKFKKSALTLKKEVLILYIVLR